MAGDSSYFTIPNLILAAGSGVVLMGLGLAFSDLLHFESLNFFDGLSIIAMGIRGGGDASAQAPRRGKL